MDADIIGFVNGNLTRQKILEVLENPVAPMDAKRIGKTLRLAPLIVSRSLAEMEEKKLIVSENSYYSLTADGKETLQFVRMLL